MGWAWGQSTTVRAAEWVAEGGVARGEVRMVAVGAVEGQTGGVEARPAVPGAEPAAEVAGCLVADAGDWAVRLVGA